MSSDGGPHDAPGFELPLRLFLAFRAIIDELHAELAREGHPDLRPMHGFVFQAIGPDGTTAVELGRRLECPSRPRARWWSRWSGRATWNAAPTPGTPAGRSSG
ncbi:hypothetical protein ACFQY7_25785 [Actinomadura luteofluorescens]|uniref:hypothetical protein n=1 Tax=Actinomadura luteofluorescens TaxID=46163 RepID=UPI0036391493